MIELRMPSFGADMDAATFVHWLVQPGQALRRGAIVAVVETQKGAIDVELWEDGTMARLLAEPGQRIPVGQLMAVLAGAGEDWREVAQAPLPAADRESTTGPRPDAATVAAPAPGALMTPGPSSMPAPSGVRASPAARQRAAALGVDLDALARRLGGRPIALADVEQAAAMPVDRAQAMRDAIGAAMARSKREIPHYYLGCEILIEPALRWLEDFNRERPLPQRVLFAALALRAIALALRETPALNGHCRDGRFEAAKAIHPGVVTALRGGGLLVPTVHDADRLSLEDTMRALRAALERARRGQLRSSDLADSTVTISSMGELGAEIVYGVIFPPQVALIGMGSVALRPAVRDGAVVAARTLHVSLAADHRVSDGLVGARFLAALRERLSHPEDS